jgi:hypothetical protein
MQSELLTKLRIKHNNYVMKYRQALVALLLALTSQSVQAQLFPSAKPEAKAGLRWWWPGSAVDTANLAWSLRQYAQAGAGAVEITPIYGVQGNEKNDIPYLSDRWMEMLRFTEKEAKKNGLEVDMATGTGWPFGGPWVPLEESASRMVIVDTTVVGKNFKLLNVSPPSDKQGCIITALVAFGDGKAFPIWNFLKEDGSRNVYIEGLSYDKHQRSNAIANWGLHEETVNGQHQSLLRLKMKKKGTWRIIALYRQPGVMKVKRPAPGGEGWVIDHFDKRAVSHYLQHIEQAFECTRTPYPHTFFNDSYEVGNADFTPTLFSEFEKRRGYSLLESLDKLVDGDQQVVADYRETLSDLLLENFTQTWTAWAHSHGAITRNQAHGSPANLLDCYAAVDIPEIEGFGLTDFGLKGLRRDSGFTRKNDSDFSMLKYAPSAAHVMGKPFTSSETATWLTEHFRTSLSQIKPDLDLMFCAGVNHVFFHGTCYSPKDDTWPGWKFYASIDMSPTNTIWRDAPWLMRYIERCQTYLQWGQPDNDFLVYLPIHNLWAKRSKGKRLMQFAIHTMNELAPEFVGAVDSLENAGYDCDYVSDRQLLQTRFVDGQLQTAGGMRYKALVLTSASDILTPRLKQHLDSLRQLGAPIIIGIDTKAMAQVAKPEELKTQWGLKLIRRKNADGYHYFIANLTPHDIDGCWVRLGVGFSQALLVDPMTGHDFTALTRGDSVWVSLRSGESVILLTRNRGHELAEPLPPLPLTNASRQEVKLNGPWRLSFAESMPADSKVYTLQKPAAWENLDDTTRTLMGTGVYETAFRLGKKQPTWGTWTIDLGDVRESARVFVNDSLIGCAWAVPYVLQFDGSLLHRGVNKLRIEVTNLPANRISQLDREGMKWRKMKDINVVNIHYEHTSYANWKPMPSGLNSEVKLYREELR